MPLTEAQLRIGRLFESEFERQAHKRGLMCVRHCDQLGVHGVKAPIATGPYAGLRLPDFSVMGAGSMFWVEAKYKTERTHHHISDTWEHGIDLPNWVDYLEIEARSGQRGFIVVGQGDIGGILIQSFKYLRKVSREYHGNKHFEHGAVFWPCAEFKPWGEFNPRNAQLSFAFRFNGEDKGSRP
jgi:hypothetical protein